METAKSMKALVRCALCTKLNRVDAARAKDRPTCGECGRPLLLDRPLTVTDQDLDRVIAESDIPVVVDFWAEWCGPCKFMAPIFDEMARDRTGKVLFTKLDTDRNQESTRKFRIHGIPTLVVFRGGREIARQVGAVPRQELNRIVDEALEG